MGVWPQFRSPLVVSVHSVVSFDFTVAIVPGWHSTIFPPYFVAGTIYSGFAMVLTLVIPLRAVYHLEDLITPRHLDYMAQVLLATGLIVAYGYMMELLMAWYSRNQIERFTQMNRMFGPYAWVFWLVVACNVVAPQAAWFRRVRYNVPALFVLAPIMNLGMWLER
jgi:Ni/Fe-hydrogenase subunit HybB-like protein